MQMQSKCDMSVPIHYVHEQLIDFMGFETMLIGYGANVSRLDNREDIGVGMKWLVEGQFRGKDRAIQLEMFEYEECEVISYKSSAKEVDAEVSLNLIALSPQETRLTLLVKPRANTISARLILQSAKLARKSLKRRLDNRMAEYAEIVEQRYYSGE